MRCFVGLLSLVFSMPFGGETFDAEAESLTCSANRRPARRQSGRREPERLAKAPGAQATRTSEGYRD
jgi:hypothetical protein